MSSKIQGSVKNRAPGVAEEWVRKLEKYLSAQRRSAFDL